ncbi:MAG: MBL fold metallo-hydrolase [Candidatus Pacebacteria bacterium]|nr:MBL fold metallo-hydrolase [Candidatus Paceibacterota bacterium]
MENKIFLIRSLILGTFVLFIILFGFLSWQNQTSANSGDDLLTVAFLDVGQGDAIFIETPDGVQMLIDGGAGNAVLRELSKQMPISDRDLDIVLATHSDKDHIGGLVDVLERYEVENIITSNNKNDTTVSEAFDLAVSKEEADLKMVSTGYQLALGASTSLMIFSPLGDASNWETNTASIVAMLRYDDTEFMLTGDAPISIEEYLVKTYGTDLESEVLKLGHHGSRTSSGENFLDNVKPKYGIVSAGKDNTYGHPHSEVVENLQKRNISILNTADDGTIVFKSDGNRVWREE